MDSKLVDRHYGAAGLVTSRMGLHPMRKLKMDGKALSEALRGGRVLDGVETLEPVLAAYVEARNAQNVFIINVESRPALDRLDELLAVPGLDAVLVGPHDLSCGLGVPEQYGHPISNKAVTTIITKARAANVGVGLHYSEDTEREIGWASEGANFIVHASDQSIASQAMRAQFDILRKGMGDAAL